MDLQNTLKAKGGITFTDPKTSTATPLKVVGDESVANKELNGVLYHIGTMLRQWAADQGKSQNYGQ